MRWTIWFAIPIAVFAGGTLLAQQPDRIDMGYFANGEVGQYRVLTSLIIQNQESEEARIQVRFRRADGEPMDGLTLRTRARNSNQHQTGAGGEIEELRIPPEAFRNFESTGEGPLQLGSCSLQSNSAIRVHSRVRLVDADGNLVTEVNIHPSGRFRTGGFHLDRRDPKDVGLSLTNTSAGVDAVCVLQLYESVDGDGDDVPLLEGDGVTLTLGGDGQNTRMLKELFEDQYEQTLKAFLEDPLTGDVYATVTCDNPVHAVVLHLHGLTYLDIPVNPVDPD